MTENLSYNAENIKVLKGLEAVRLRPSMYIGDTHIKGLHHLVYELVDNSIDEAMAGFCSKITVSINKDGSITVEDNGRGIPTDIHPTEKKSGVEVALTILHAGGKFDKNTYKVSGGLHGVGLSVVNALSTKLKIIVKRAGKIYVQDYIDGNPQYDLKIIGETTETGTSVNFIPSSEIFSTVVFDYQILATRLRELAFLNSGLKIIIKDERNEKIEEFHYAGGLNSFVQFINEGKKPIHKDPIYIQKSKEGCGIEVAMQYTDAYTENVFSFVNNINTIEGGTHVVGFSSALTRIINSYIRKNNLSDVQLSGNDVREGLTAVISMKVPNPQFEGQTKTKLGNSNVKGLVDSIVFEALGFYFEENPTIAKSIIEKSIVAFKAREAAKKARELIRRKSVLGGNSLPGKLIDCREDDAKLCELFLVEGDSAAGTAISARNRKIQAILPLRGKVLNVEKSRLDKILKSEQILNIISALGSGIGEDFNLTKLRYHKIIILTDADVDGAHIACLLLTLFYRYMRPLVDGGHVYLAQPPLYKCLKGKQSFYVRDDVALAEVNKNSEFVVQRFKGLGEMDSAELEETVMDVSKRVLKQVKVEDAVEADRMFSILMGDEVEPRREFIMAHAREVKNLDI